MKIFQCSKIGEYHINHNEDSLINTQIGNDKIVIAVMDGCSMGIDSHFASSLLKKILKKVSTEIHYKEFIQKELFSAEETLNLILHGVFKDLSTVKNIINLETEEILTTLILIVIDKELKSGEGIVIGDGIINYNGKLFEYDQDNKPDYIGYHIDKQFETWVNSQTQKLSLEDIEEISISTDGIYSFKKYHSGNFDDIEDGEIIKLLLNDRKELENPKMLLNKIDLIEKEYGMRNYDDISIIRIIL